MREWERVRDRGSERHRERVSERGREREKCEDGQAWVEVARRTQLL